MTRALGRGSIRAVRSAGTSGGQGAADHPLNRLFRPGGGAQEHKGNRHKGAVLGGQYCRSGYLSPRTDPFSGGIPLYALSKGFYNETVSSERRSHDLFRGTPGSRSGSTGWEKVKCVGVTL